MEYVILCILHIYGLHFVCRDPFNAWIISEANLLWRFSYLVVLTQCALDGLVIRRTMEGADISDTRLTIADFCITIFVRRWWISGVSDWITRSAFSFNHHHWWYDVIFTLFTKRIQIKPKMRFTHGTKHAGSKTQTPKRRWKHSNVSIRHQNQHSACLLGK